MENAKGFIKLFEDIWWIYKVVFTEMLYKDSLLALYKSVIYTVYLVLCKENPKSTLG